ncbi:MAG: hypothetical protein EPN86_03785 [Nanoarchaeota archaeon]|nr:MAG: hypothetical protein EPN86_03785 [Nanoarchaeota archaeon]
MMYSLWDFLEHATNPDAKLYVPDTVLERLIGYAESDGVASIVITELTRQPEKEEDLYDLIRRAEIQIGDKRVCKLYGDGTSLYYNGAILPVAPTK